MSTAREDLFAALLDSGVFPALDPKTNDTALGYLRRCAEALAKRYEHVPVSVTLLDASGGMDRGIQVVEPTDESAIVATFQIEEPTTVVVAGFQAEFGAVHRLLPASLIQHLRIASQYSFEIFTPTSALEVAEFLYFRGDCKDWLDEMRMEAAEEIGCQHKDVTGRELRRYLQRGGIRTPGYFKRRIGASHAAIQRPGCLLSLERCAEILDTAPAQTRSIGLRVIYALQQLYQARDTLKLMLSRRDRDIWSTAEADFPFPGIIIEPNDGEREQLVAETIEELWQTVAHDRGFGPNYLVTLANKRDGKRFIRALDSFSVASNAIRDIINAIAAA